VRKRTIEEANVYGQTIVRRTYDGRDIELKRIITGREYQNLLKGRDLSRHIVTQKRLCFLHSQQSFTIHIYLKPVSDLCIVHCQSSNDAGGIEEIPKFLQSLMDRQLDLDSPNSEDGERYGAHSISVKERGGYGFIESPTGKHKSNKVRTPAKFR